ncbi:MAG: RNA-binding protein [Treponema sp.]|jgi:RNA recognition motif-containing protein|nr:RNA-binding protein [Treponema sp.]MBQ2233991.1 RNA-binding protein [Treponema sp.]MBQ5646165.1 RNA-binding protein [Treponema sp.]MBQ5848152.1 RNA-binding protein [Treponema sp.]MBQ5877262.1 RNA-binding protein [Treponema sp.]
MSTKIYIGNLSFSTTEETLQNKFESFGTIESVSIIRDKNTQMSKGFGFVEMEDEIAANKAVSSLHGTMIDSRKVRVNIARDIQNRQKRD